MLICDETTYACHHVFVANNMLMEMADAASPFIPLFKKESEALKKKPLLQRGYQTVDASNGLIFDLFVKAVVQWAKTNGRWRNDRSTGLKAKE